MTSKLGFIMAADGSAIELGRFGSSRTLVEQRAAGLFFCGYSHLFNGLITSPVVIIIVFLDVLVCLNLLRFKNIL